MTLRSLAVLALLTPPACFSADDPLDDEDSRFPAKGDGSIEEGSAEARAVLALVNDPTVGFAELDDDAGLNATAARNIIDHRDAEGAFDDLAELDAVPFVGPVALEALLQHAIAKGLLVGGGEIEVIFSPQPEGSNHAARIVKIIDAADVSLDIAMYSFSDAAISDAIERATARGVAVRFIFETAGEDNKLTGSDLASSKSGRLERAGVDVRFVNKIMHHKYMIADGPRDELARAATATVVTGSANWSHNGGSVYDENTLFASGNAELALSLQREFNLMWEHSRDLVVDQPFDRVLSKLDVTADLVASQNDPSLEVHTTSANFTVGANSTTFRTDRDRLTVADAWVDAIERAQSSIFIASGHMRLRPVAEALIAKKQANPNIDIRVYLDGQEYISTGGDIFQRNRLDDCLAKASSDVDTFNCRNKSFLFSKALADAGIDVRFKFYAFRWHFAYAVQMHHKYMIIDGNELLTGSYNLSINAEHSTFENVVHVRGSDHAALIDQFVANFSEVFETGRADDLLGELSAEVASASEFPIVFPSMALSWQEVTDLKDLIVANCDDIFTDDFRRNAPAHRSCRR